MENKQPEKNSNSNKRKAAFTVIAISFISVLGFFAYRTLSGIKSKEDLRESNQEQFAGGAQISEQLQAECQKSVEKLSSLSDAQSMFSEYRQNVENCREVYFSSEQKTNIRNEGMYPDVVVDIAAFAAKTSRPLALEVLQYAKSINPWEFYMGPIVCNSLATIEAYIESLTLDEERICFKPATDKEKLISEIRSKNFSIISKTLSHDRVISVGSPESEEGCPEKVSSIIKLVQEATSGNLSVDEEQIENSRGGAVNFVFKSKSEDKIILEFAAFNDCLQLHTILIPAQTTNE